MTQSTPQFGEKPQTEYVDRLCAYAVVFNDKGQLLALEVNGVFHLPGGGIDENESSEAAVIREVEEESGYKVTNLQFIGKANQYSSRTGKILRNKIGSFYTAEIISSNPLNKIEADHEITWLNAKEFLDSNASDFQKWAVRETLL